MENTELTPLGQLALMMRRRGWSAARLAGIAGNVSASSVRSYAADRSVPRAQQALAVANALGRRDGCAMLEAWGYHDLAEGFAGRWADRHRGTQEQTPAAEPEYHRDNRLEYPGEPLSEPGPDFLRAVAAWIQHVEARPGTGRPASIPPRAEG